MFDVYKQLKSIMMSRYVYVLQTYVILSSLLYA